MRHFRGPAARRIFVASVAERVSRDLVNGQRCLLPFELRTSPVFLSGRVLHWWRLSRVTGVRAKKKTPENTNTFQAPSHAAAAAAADDCPPSTLCSPSPTISPRHSPWPQHLS